MDNTTIRVLITRKLDQKQANIEHTYPLEIVSIPFIETVYDITHLKNQVSDLLKKPITAIITSQNGVLSLLSNFGKEIVAKAPWKIYCIGFTTKEKIKTYFSTSTIIDTAENIEILSDKMLHEDIEKFYFFGSNIRQQSWIDKLKQQHKQVEEYWVYQTQYKIQQVDCRLYQAIVFFSPSAVYSFFQQNHISIDIPIFAIGHTTQKAILKYGNYKVILPLQPEYESLLTTIKQYFNGG